MSSSSDFPFLPVIAGGLAAATAGVGLIGETAYQIGRNRQVWSAGDEIDMLQPSRDANIHINKIVRQTHPARKRAYAQTLSIPNGPVNINILPNTSSEIKYKTTSWDQLSVAQLEATDPKNSEIYMAAVCPNIIDLGTAPNNRVSKSIHMIGMKLSYSVSKISNVYASMGAITESDLKTAMFFQSRYRIIVLIDKSPNNTYFGPRTPDQPFKYQIVYPTNTNSIDVMKVLAQPTFWDISFPNTDYTDRFIPIYDRTGTIDWDLYPTGATDPTHLTKGCRALNQIYIPLNITCNFTPSTTGSTTTEDCITTNKIVILLCGDGGQTHPKVLDGGNNVAFDIQTQVIFQDL